jgi:hypothetical protein
VKRLWLILVALLIAATVQAQLPYSAALRVLNVGVEFRRLNTEAWERVRQHAEMPFGAGDVLRLNDEGRALITFADGVELLVLPHGELEILQFEQAGDTLTLRLRFSGQAAGAVTDPARFSQFEIETAQGVVTQPAQHFALQVDESAARLIAAAGTAVFDAGGDTVSVSAGEGARITADGIETANYLASPMHFARLDSLLDACPGTARATERDSVNIRQGPGSGYDIIGEVPNGAPVEIVATTPQRDRYRVRFLSGFGWVVADGIVTACADLPVLPYDTLERVYGVIGITADDTRLLEAFFGTWRDDYLFYPIIPE